MKPSHMKKEHGLRGIFQALLAVAFLCNVPIVHSEVAGNRPGCSTIQFEDVTEGSGVSKMGYKTYGSAWGDANSDGYPDLLANPHHVGPVALYMNRKGKGFVDEVKQRIPKLPVEQDPHHQVWLDIDNDGDQDLFLMVSGESAATAVGEASQPNRLYINNGGVFTDEAVRWGVDYRSARSTNCVWLDIDNDGHLDFFHGCAARPDNLFPSTFFKYAGGKYADVGTEVLAPFIPKDAPLYLGNACWTTDIDDDGRMELIVDAFGVLDVTSTPFTRMTEFDAIRGNDMVFADFTGDARVDAVCVNGASPHNTEDFGLVAPNHIRAFWNRPQNQTEFQFRVDGGLEVGLSRHIRSILLAGTSEQIRENSIRLNPEDPRIQISGEPKTTAKMVTVGYDPEQQLWRFIAAPGTRGPFQVIADKPVRDLKNLGIRVYPNTFDPTVVDLATARFTMKPGPQGCHVLRVSGRSVTAGDFDNDMDLDLFILGPDHARAWPNIVLENDGTGTFSVVPGSAGAVGPHLQAGDRATMADYDLDGYLDIFTTNAILDNFPLSNAKQDRHEVHALFRNKGGSNHWLMIDLKGTKSNRDGLGAKVFLTAGGVRQLREQNGGIRKDAQDHQRIHFGLGKNKVAESIEVVWPSGVRQTLEAIACDQVITITES